MFRSIFFPWFLRFDSHIGLTQDRKVLLMIDNASCHATQTELPSLHHVTVRYLPACTTSVLQLLDCRVIAAFKLRYQSRVAERAVRLIENRCYRRHLQSGLEDGHILDE